MIPFFDNQYLFCGLPMKNVSKATSRKLAEARNRLEIMNTFVELSTNRMNLYKWNNLPDTCSEYIIERALYSTGMVLFADVDGALVNLAAAPASGYNINGWPVRAYGYALNGFNHQFSLYIDGMEESDIVLMTPDRRAELGYDAVLGRDNRMWYPPINIVLQAAERIADSTRAMDVAANNLKQPVMVSCEESQINSIKEILSQRDSNTPAVVSTGRLAPDAITVYDLHASPDALRALREHVDYIDGRVRQSIGISAAAQLDKSERLLVDEVNANQEMVSLSLEKCLIERQEMADRVNRAFPDLLPNGPISVEIRQKPAVKEGILDGDGDDQNIPGQDSYGGGEE